MAEENQGVYIAERQQQKQLQLIANFGTTLLASPEDTRAIFKRVANWTRDQHIIGISRVFSTDTTSASLADVMADEWHHIIGVDHATLTGLRRERLFDRRVRIPAARQVTDAWNNALIAPITGDETTNALKSLQKHKAAGSDDLSNDLFKNCGEELEPVLTTVFNQILKGAKIPESFLAGLVLPLKKNGDSNAAMDYRPITVLQTAYKLFAKIVARRVQAGLHTIIGQQQQGFVKSRQLARSVAVMQAVLTGANNDPNQSIDDAPMVVMIDFAKAYDTLSRGYLFLVLRRFGFSDKFVELMTRMHKGTQAQFVVNQERSRAVTVRSGIRQGCPLAPLLFIVAVEALALMIEQDTALRGIPVPGANNQEASVTAFVDDTTVYISEERQVPTLKRLLRDFEAISGLKAQAAKSHAISLNSNVNQREYWGIQMVGPDETVRYLGVQVGLRNAQTTTWDKRIAGLRTRLALATRVTTSVIGRVKIANAIALPAILFSAQFVKPTGATLSKLENLQKNFIWHGRMSTQRCRHKMPPSLVYAPVAMGGLGLQAIGLAVKAQAARRATQWLLEKESIFKDCWRVLVSDGADPRIQSDEIQPQRYSTVATAKMLKDANIYCVGKEAVCEQLLLSEKKEDGWEARAAKSVQEAVKDAELTWRDNATILEIKAEHPHADAPTQPTTMNFWPTFKWGQNGWLVSADGKPLSRTKFGFLHDERLEKLELTRISATQYTFVAPLKAKQWTARRIEKLKEWIVAIVLGSPRLQIGETMACNRDVHLRQQPKLQRNYVWLTNGAGAAIGADSDRRCAEAFIDLKRSDAGWLWTVEGASRDEMTKADEQTMRTWCRTQGATFVAHPRTTTFPCWIPDAVTNKHGLQERDREFKKQQREATFGKPERLVAKLNKQAAAHEWDRDIQTQTLKQVWRHEYSITSFQAWTWYRISFQLLNLYHSEWEGRGTECDLEVRCTAERSIAHIVWKCKRATAVWDWWAKCWTGSQLSAQQAAKWRRDARLNVVLRNAPAASSNIVHEVTKQFGRFTPQHADAMKRIWFVAATTIPTVLWCLRNETVFRKRTIRADEAAVVVARTVRRQLEAICNALASTKVTNNDGICLRQCSDALYQAIPVHTLSEPRKARLQFDGGARGNPGVGGSGWVIATQPVGSTTWVLDQCGYKYQGTTATNNLSEYDALLQGLAMAKQRFRNTSTMIQVVGDSNMIIKQMTGRATVKQPHLLAVAQRVQEVSRAFAAVTWVHARRTHNKAADYMANVAMDSKERAVLTEEEVGIRQEHFQEVARLLRGDTETQNTPDPERTLVRILVGQP